MTESRASLAQRIRELRRRHFGRTGKRELAERLGLTQGEYESFERNTIPSADVILRMCELTGEDLQWLLTGVASRGTMVISGARPRHQELLGRIAEALNAQPELAAPLEAFFDLLTAGPKDTSGARRALPVALSGASLIPIYEAHELPIHLPPVDPSAARYPLATCAPPGALATAATAVMEEPGGEHVGSHRPVALVRSTESPRRFVQSDELAQCFPNAFAVAIDDDTMRPMFEPGDALIVAADAPPVLGRPALCHTRHDPRVRCRMWLGEDGGQVRLGRMSDHGVDSVPADEICWSLEVLYRVTLRN